MQYFAFHRAECLTSGPDLDEVLAFTASCCDPSVPEDAVIDDGVLVVAVVTSSGHVISFEAMPTPITWRVSA